jgi:hypothetical protein
VAGNFIWSMRALAQTLRYEAGLKYVILCSKGIKGKDIGRGEYAYGRNTDLSRDYEEMCREIAAANISIYPINTADTTIGFQQIDKADWKESKTGVPFLREFASHTGGRFLGPARNAPELMDRLQALTGSYYVLGYPVSEAWDGKYHAVRVNVRRSGVEVQAQPGYFDPKLFAAYSKIEREIDLVDLALADDPMSQDPIRFGMTLWPTACAAGRSGPQRRRSSATSPRDDRRRVGRNGIASSSLRYQGKRRARDGALLRQARPPGARMGSVCSDVHRRRRRRQPFRTPDEGDFGGMRAKACRACWDWPCPSCC